MRKFLIAAIVASTAGAPALATGKMTCDVAEADRHPIEHLEAKLKTDGWAVRKAKVDGGCYEVYATDDEGRRVEAYFDPATFEKLYVSQRGKVLFEKAD